MCTHQSLECHMTMWVQGSKCDNEMQCNAKALSISAYSTPHPSMQNLASSVQRIPDVTHCCLETLCLQARVKVTALLPLPILGQTVDNPHANTHWPSLREAGAVGTCTGLSVRAALPSRSFAASTAPASVKMYLRPIKVQTHRKKKVVEWSTRGPEDRPALSSKGSKHLPICSLQKQKC